MDIFWEKSGWERYDPHLKELRGQPFFRPFPNPPEKPGLYIVRGPRQVGKSSWLKTVLSHHVKKGKRCFYLSCEDVENHRELSAILRAIRGTSVVLLDEISFVDQWDRSIKAVLDQKLFPIVMMTGSNQVDLRKGADRMPGRWGEGGNIFLLPSDLTEFRRLRNLEKHDPSAPPLAELLYFQVGGFPRAIAESWNVQATKTSKATVTKAGTTYARWLFGDAARHGKNEAYLKQLIGQIALTMGTPISFQTLAAKTQIGSHHTVAEYLQYLEDVFAIRILYAMDASTGAYRFRKNKKLYFTDPLLYWIALKNAALRTPKNWEECMAEMVACECLFRRFSKFGYYSSRKGEIDFYAPQKWSLEVKWTSVPTNISKAYFETPTAHRILWSHSNFGREWPTEVTE